MQIVRTKNGGTINKNNKPPRLACIGTCKKVWWEEDIGEKINMVGAVIKCPNCNGKLEKATEGKHYTVITP